MRPAGNRTILVSGGAGFIGSHFIRYVLTRSTKTKVVCVDALTYAGNRENLKGLPKKRFTFIKGDITDVKRVSQLCAKYRPAYLINFAAETHVDRSIHGGAADFLRTNVNGTATLLEVARQIPQFKKFVQVSTDEVYGSLPLTSAPRFTEKSPLAPNSPYAASKAAADLLARAYYKTYALPVVITRCSNNYGSHQHPEKLIPYSIQRVMGGKPIAIYGDGRYVRDWIHVEDHCRALFLALTKGAPGQIYNIGAREEIDNLTLATRMLRYLKKDPTTMIAFVKDRPGHDRRYAVDASKMRKELGWRPLHSLKRDLGATISWYVHNRGWMKRALARAGGANAHI